MCVGNKCRGSRDGACGWWELRAWMVEVEHVDDAEQRGSRAWAVNTNVLGRGGADWGETKPAGVGGRLIIKHWAAVFRRDASAQRAWENGCPIGIQNAGVPGNKQKRGRWRPVHNEGAWKPQWPIAWPSGRLENYQGGEGQGKGCQRRANAAVSTAHRRRKLEIMVETSKKNMLAKVKSKQEGQRRRGARAVEVGGRLEGRVEGSFPALEVVISSSKLAKPRLTLAETDHSLVIALMV
ncbi:hypothetical protein DFH08DRAFT_815386 [Mycena albidolilacea]|uniref:Uncharacterized protein n=1 Tax=Mycena albidolilacea TaxID=1033008 RepID=A0AAD7EKP7_9AGAR|nr:hypothetical protein DFH08DRAFT_815386 [Mycena albidolilacea]